MNLTLKSESAADELRSRRSRHLPGVAEFTSAD